jgi:glycosyltransferase involved in cell wall biosynthesis
VTEPRRALLVSTASPYPVVTNGCARLVSDYQRGMFPGHDVWFLLARAGDWAPLELFHQGRPVAVDLHAGGLRSYDFEFVLFIGFKDTDFNRRLARMRPSFCLTDTFPHPDVPEGLFRGILSHRRDAGDDPDLFLLGGSYDGEVFHPNRRQEDIVLSVGRIHPDKHQLELVTSYRERIFEPYGLPLHLVGGVDDAEYHRRVQEHVDGVSVVSSVDPQSPLADTNWRTAHEIADMCNRARLFVSSSPKESFGMALIEAIACGTTCAVNGHYWGFAEPDLRPNVFGNITGPRGSVVDLVAQALAEDVRIDGSQWARKYALCRTRAAVADFVDARL